MGRVDGHFWYTPFWAPSPPSPLSPPPLLILPPPLRLRVHAKPVSCVHARKDTIRTGHSMPCTRALYFWFLPISQHPNSLYTETQPSRCHSVPAAACPCRCSCLSEPIRACPYVALSVMRSPYTPGHTPPPLYKLRPCPSYSRRRDRIDLVPNFNSGPNVVQPHKTWVW